MPKIPSVRIIDLAEAIAPSLGSKIVGIRPGEKLHEIMCPRDDAHLTIEFSDHYVITPSIKFHLGNNNFLENACGEHGSPVSCDFEYNSGNNPDFLDIKGIIEYNKLAGA